MTVKMYCTVSLGKDDSKNILYSTFTGWERRGEIRTNLFFNFMVRSLQLVVLKQIVGNSIEICS